MVGTCGQYVKWVVNVPTLLIDSFTLYICFTKPLALLVLGRHLCVCCIKNNDFQVDLMFFQPSSNLYAGGMGGGGFCIKANS